MLNAKSYARYRKSAKDPIQLCYFIYNSEARTKIDNYKQFCAAFTIWLSRTYKLKLLAGSQMIQNKFDKIWKSPRN